MTKPTITAILKGIFSMPTRIALYAIRGYQLLISPWLGNNCRYTPSCSEYAATALKQYGMGKGSYLACKRICRCNPLFAGGYDPVPGTDAHNALNTPSSHHSTHHTV